MLQEPYLESVRLIALATSLGLLVGLERERAGKEAGLRTFSLTALAGALTSRVSATFAMITLGFVAVVVVVVNLGALHKGRGLEMTTSAALFVTAFNGIMVGRGDMFTPVAVTIVTLLLLAWKDEMVGITRHLSREEVHAGITLLLLAAVVLPVLPDAEVDPWNLVNPRKIWVMVVLISAIGFVNYVLLRLYGARGVTYTGFLGGLVNSTAAVAELVRKCEDHPDLQDYAFRGVMLAKTSMILRNGLILALFAPTALSAGVVPVACMLVVTIGLATYSRGREPRQSPEIQLSSPFSLRAALEFGAIFLALTVVAGVAERFGGSAGFYVIAVAGGLMSSASTTASAANLASQRVISAAAAGLGAVLSSLASIVVLFPIVWRSAPGLRMRMALATALIIAAAGAGWLADRWLPLAR